MNLFKKSVSLFLVFAISLMMITACATKTEDATNGTNNATGDTKDASNGDSTAMEDEQVELTWVVIGDQHPDTEKVLEVFNEKLKDKLPNTTLNIVTYGFDNYGDRIELMITSGEDFDIMWCSSWAGDYLQKVANGAFLPLDDLIDEHAPKLKETLPEAVFQTGTYDGKLYGLTNYQQLWAGYGIVVRTDFADQYGLDVAQIEADGLDRNIKTIDIMKSMEPFFANVLANETDINSVIDPYFLVGKTVTENMVMERDYETIVSPAVIDKYNNDNIQLVNMFETQEYADFIAWMRDMYEQGFVRKDVLSAEIPTNINEDRMNMYGIMTTNTGTPEDFDIELNKINTTNEVTSARIAPLYLPYTAGTATMNFINAQSEHPERAMKLLELVNTDAEMYNLLTIGIEGDHWEMKDEIADSTVTPATILKGDDYGIFDWVIGNVANSYGRSEMFLNSRLEIWNNKATMSPLFGFVPDLSELAQDKAKIDAVVNEYVKALNSGADSDYELHYAEFKEKLKAAGVDEYIAALQGQVDVYLGQ